jgi:hypothetical protein
MPGTRGRSAGRTLAALLLLGGVAAAVAATMQAGRFRTLSWVVIGGLALRIALDRRRDGGDGVG